MPNYISLVPSSLPQITHDPTATLNGDPMGYVGDNPYGEMTDAIIFGSVNTLLGWIDDATGLDLLGLVTPLEDLLGGDTDLLSGLLGFLTPSGSTTGGGIFGPLLALIPGLSGGTLGGLGGFLQPTSFLGSASGIFGPLLSSGSLLGSLIPGLDASKIVSGTFSHDLMQPLIDAVSTGFGGTTGLSFSGLLSYLGGLEIGGISFDDIIALIPGLSGGLSGSTGLNSIFTDITSLLGAPTGLGSGSPTLPDIDNIPLLGPLIGPMLTALTGSGTGSSSTLMTALSGLLNGSSGLPAGNLFGQIGSGLLGVVPASHIATVSPNLIDDGSFNDPSALQADAVWSFDATQDHTGTTGSGSAKVTANGVAKDLSSDPLIPVATGHVLACAGWVMWSALAHAGGATPIRLSLTLYQNTGTQSRPVWSVVGTPDLAVDSSGLVASGWRQLAGAYTVTAGTDAVRLRCHVDASATAGVINWDDLSLTKTQPIPTSAIGGLDTAMAGFTAGINGLLDSLGLHVTTANFDAAINAITGGIGTSVANITTWVNGVLTGSSTLNASNIGTGAVDLAHLPDVSAILDGIGQAFAGLFPGVTHTQATDVLTQQANALVGAQAAIQQLQSTLGSGVTAGDTFNRTGAIGANWATMTQGSTVFYPHGGAGGPQCDGNNLAWVGSGNTAATKLYRWVGANLHSATNFQNVGIILSSQGEDPLFGQTSYDHILCRISDDGLNYVRGQFSPYAGNNDDIQLFYCIGGVETNFFVGGFSPVVGKGSAVNLLAGLKGSNTRTYTVYVNQNPIYQVTESGAVSQVGPGFMGWGLGLSAGNNGGLIGIQQALPGAINQWTAQDQ